jgi:hypothetical protein
MFSFAVLVAGVDTLGYLVAAFLYLRVWKKMRDFLFAALALAFVLLAASEVAFVAGYLRGDGVAIAEIFRLAAFGLLVAAVVIKSFDLGTSSL